jgi:hypothetical protein
MFKDSSLIVRAAMQLSPFNHLKTGQLLYWVAFRHFFNSPWTNTMKRCNARFFSPRTP